MKLGLFLEGWAADRLQAQTIWGWEQNVYFLQSGEGGGKTLISEMCGGIVNVL